MIAGETSLAYEQVVTLNLVRHDSFMIHIIILMNLSLNGRSN